MSTPFAVAVLSSSILSGTSLLYATLGELVGERARGRQDRIGQRHGAHLDREIYHPRHSCRSNTGPSTHTRRISFLPSTSKVRTQM